MMKRVVGLAWSQFSVVKHTLSDINVYIYTRLKHHLIPSLEVKLYLLMCNYIIVCINYDKVVNYAIISPLGQGC